MNKTSSTNTSIKIIEDTEEISLKSEKLGSEIEELLVKDDLSENHSSNDENKLVTVSTNENSYNNIKTIQTCNYRYIGEVNELNQKHGFGICEYINGGKYIGQFVDGKREGLGKLTSKNGEIFQGEFKNDVIDGFMESIVKHLRKQGYAKGFDFEGEIEIFNDENKVSVYSTSGHKMGIGTVLNPLKNYTFQGELDKSSQNGYGISYVKDKYVFKGQHNKQGFHGYGEVYRPDGSRYFGFYNNNCKSGFGISFNREGKVAFGRYIDDNKHGPFLHYFKNVTRIEMFNYGFKYKTIDKIETAKNYFKIYYPEFDWIFKINIKAISDLFNDVKTDEFLQQEKITQNEEIKTETKDQPTIKDLKDNDFNNTSKGENIEINLKYDSIVEKSVKKDNVNDLSEILN